MNGVRVELRLFANLRDRLPREARGRTTVVLPQGATVGDVVQKFQIPPALAHLVLVNGVNIEGDMNRELQSGDEISIFPPVAGG